jgi:hypothetical protein
MKNFREFLDTKSLDEKTFIDSLMAFTNRMVFNRKTYQLAFDELHTKMGESPYNRLLTIASKVSKKYRDVDYVELSKMYIEVYPEFESHTTGNRNF